MHCPKCGGEIPFYDLKPNCKHCGVNIRYYTQESKLMRDAKRTELEGAAARMVIARVKAAFIGGKLSIARLVFTLLAAAALVVPFGGVKFMLPLFERSFSVGIIGLIQSFQNGLLTNLPHFLNSSLVRPQTVAALIPAAVFVCAALLDVVILVAYILSFLNLTKSAKFMKNAALIGAILSAVGQIAVLVTKFTTADSETAAVSLGFGSLAACAMFAVLFLLNHAMLKKGIEPKYKENDIKRREMLKKVRAGEVDLDSLPLPVFESDDERAERMKQLEEALKAEEEGKEL